MFLGQLRLPPKLHIIGKGCVSIEPPITLSSGTARHFVRSSGGEDSNVKSSRETSPVDPCTGFVVLGEGERYGRRSRLKIYRPRVVHVRQELPASTNRDAIWERAQLCGLRGS